MAGGASDAEFAAFVRGAQQRLVRYADMLCGDRGRAEDLVQHALLKTFLAWRRVATGNPEAYARTIVSHAYVDWWHRRTWRETSTDEIPEPRIAVGETDHADSLARRDSVLRALARLTPRERAMVSMEEWNVDALFGTIRQAAPFAELSRVAFDGVLP